MKERLELVKSFAELRTGMIVVYTPCDSCGGRHRAMLGNKLSDLGYFTSGELTNEPGFVMLPSLPCSRWQNCQLTAVAVKRGAVFCVVDGLESSTSTERTKELAR